MIAIGDVSGDIRRCSILLARRANATGDLVVWVTPSGIVACAHVASARSKVVLAETPEIVLNTYSFGARAFDILGDLQRRLATIMADDLTGASAEADDVQ